METPGFQTSRGHEQISAEICALGWERLSEADMLRVAHAYYYFSIQFRENLEIACDLFPEDRMLAKLKQEECATDNLSPYPGIAQAGEKLDHDEFMRRALALAPVGGATAMACEASGTMYLRDVRELDLPTRALSIPAYEDGGLERLFRAMLTAPPYENATLAAFRFFMAEHIRFDSDPVAGHGALSRHMTASQPIEPLWEAFGQMLLELVPDLQTPHEAALPAMAGDAT